MMLNNPKEDHLDVYKNRYVLHQGGDTLVYYQGFQSKPTQERYNLIQHRLAEGFLERELDSISSKDFSALSEDHKDLLKNMVTKVTSEAGRALVGLLCLQLAIKTIAPEQSIRLHKGSTTKGKFSWVDGISMRSLDRNYNTPFLRKHGLLNVNRDGVFMTRSLAENYPYTMLYKAEMRGAFNYWVKAVDAIESNTMPSELGLCYLLALLKNRSSAFQTNANKACALALCYRDRCFNEIKELMVRFFNSTDYSARAFEVTMHCLCQALEEMDLLGDAQVVPLSQMRSANKKHGNVGDIEISENGIIVEAWDAKYGKPYLRDELEELRDKLLTHPDVRLAGFVCNTNIDRRSDITARKTELEDETGTKVLLLSFNEWVNLKVKALNEIQINRLGYKWLTTVTESFAQKRLNAAPIDEPCDAWISSLISIMEAT